MCIFEKDDVVALRYLIPFGCSLRLVMLYFVSLNILSEIILFGAT